MGFYVNPTEDSFADVLGNGRYVDKSGLIAYMNSVLRTSDKLVASTRPRRFGKSFAAKMLAAYYSKGADAGTLFEKLEIARLGDEAGYREHLNKHDVIFLDVTSFISVADNIKNVVSDMQDEAISELKEAYPNCVREDTKSLLKALMQVCSKTGSRFIIIIDEWDALFREAKDDEELQRSYIQFLRSLFITAKTARIISGAYMTGILPIKKYGTQSALTDFREYTMLEPGPLASFIGFTEEEVRRLCDTNYLSFDETQRWYDGYQFSAVVVGESDGQRAELHSVVHHVYCPNSIMELVARKKFGSYWTKTETYESLRYYIDLNYDGLRDALVDMLGGRRCRIDVRTFQNDMTSITNRDDVFTLLVHLGYLAFDSDREEVFIPNEEIRGEFITAVREGSRPELAKAVKMSDKLLAATLTGDGEAVAQMEEKQYPEIMKKFGYEGKLLLVGINYSTKTGKHTCRIEECKKGK